MPVRLPVNTTSFFQPCDQHVNRQFKREIRHIKDELLTISPTSNSNISLKINLAIAAYKSLNAGIVKRSFVNCGPWPMNFSFLDRHQEKPDHQ